jgi:hypothetical protein
MDQTQNVPNERMLGIAAQLLQKTRSGQVRWVSDIVMEDGYVVYLPNSRIRLDRDKDLNGRSSRVRLQLENDAGRTVGNLVAERDEPGWDVLQNLQAAAAQASSRWTEVLDEVEAALSGPGVVGTR